MKRLAAAILGAVLVLGIAAPAGAKGKAKATKNPYASSSGAINYWAMDADKTIKIPAPEDVPNFIGAVIAQPHYVG